MPRPKTIKPEVEEELVLTPGEVKTPVSAFDPTIPENKQRHLRV